MASTPIATMPVGYSVRNNAIHEDHAIENTLSRNEEQTGSPVAASKRRFTGPGAAVLV
jgi:hypothetical protein